MVVGRVITLGPATQPPLPHRTPISTRTSISISMFSWHCCPA